MAIPRSPSMNSTHSSIPDPFPEIISNFGRGAFQSKDLNLVRQWQASVMETDVLNATSTGSPPTTTFLQKKQGLEAFRWDPCVSRRVLSMMDSSDSDSAS